MPITMTKTIARPKSTGWDLIMSSPFLSSRTHTVIPKMKSGCVGLKKRWVGVRLNFHSFMADRETLALWPWHARGIRGARAYGVSPGLPLSTLYSETGAARRVGVIRTGTDL